MSEPQRKRPLTIDEIDRMQADGSFIHPAKTSRTEFLSNRKLVTTLVMLVAGFLFLVIICLWFIVEHFLLS
jgi:hypothetical protein